LWRIFFVACDTDGDGALTVDEIFNYLYAEDASQQTFRHALAYTARTTTRSVVWWFAVAFHFAAWVGMTSFCLATTIGRHIRPEWSLVGAWFFFCGAVYFFKLLLDYESCNYDTMVQAKIILKTAVDKDPAFFDSKAGVDDTMDPYELNTVLEEHALYVPKFILTKIFEDIDTDKTGTITKDEILGFAKTQTTDPTPQERQTAISKAVVRTWGFWSLSCWFIGSILFLVAAHLNYAGYTEPPLPKNTYLHLYGMGSVLYFLLAVCMLPMIDSEVQDYLESIEQMSKAFAQRRERSGLTTDAESFRSLDVGSDGNLDVMELYEALIEEGLLIPYDTLLALFKSADRSGDGKLQLGEFTEFIANMHVAKDDPWRYRWQMLQRVPFTSSFFGWFMFFVGGIFYTMGSYINVAHSAVWYFAGAICYGMASAKNVFGTVMGHYRHFYAVEAGKAEFKARIGIAADTNDGSTKIV
jgi:Ca2+-binding EF-hand superfamily protein